MQRDFAGFLEDLRTHTNRVHGDKVGLIGIRCAMIVVILRKSLYQWEYAENNTFETSIELCSDFGDFYTEVFDKVLDNGASILCSGSAELRYQAMTLAASFSAVSRGDDNEQLIEMVRRFSQALYELATARRYPGLKTAPPKQLPPPTPPKPAKTDLSGPRKVGPFRVYTGKSG